MSRWAFFRLKWRRVWEIAFGTPLSVSAIDSRDQGHRDGCGVRRRLTAVSVCARGLDQYGWEKMGGAAELELSRGDLSFYVIRDAEPIALVAAWELETQGLEERGQTKGDRLDISRALTVALPYIGGQDFSVEFQLIALNQARLVNIDGGEIRGAMESYALGTAKLLGVSVLDLRATLFRIPPSCPRRVFKTPSCRQPQCQNRPRPC